MGSSPCAGGHRLCHPNIRRFPETGDSVDRGLQQSVAVHGTHVVVYSPIRHLYYY